MIVSVLCVSTNSIYKTFPSVECYDKNRDVRTFDGSTPVVAHPPCRAWSAFCAHQAKPQPGEKELGPLCVDFVRQCGGVLEHPAYSRLWTHCGLPLPGEPEQDGVWSMAVNQAWFGDCRTKRTWLLFSGVDRDSVNVPFRLHDSHGDRRRWQVMSKTQRAATSLAMAAWLVGLARMAAVNGKRAT